MWFLLPLTPILGFGALSLSRCRLHTVTAEMIMATPVIGFPSLVSVAQVHGAGLRANATHWNSVGGLAS